MNTVKNADTTVHTIAVLPGIQPKSARKTRSSRAGVRPSASRNPASVNSGIDGSVGLTDSS